VDRRVIVSSVDVVEGLGLGLRVVVEVVEEAVGQGHTLGSAGLAARDADRVLREGRPRWRELRPSAG
jgi:hypothetical protein